jgi:hypothetical protein
MISVIRVNFIVEGQTEETFVNRILAESLAKSGVYVNGARCVETGRKKIRGLKITKPGKQEIIFRGGMPSFEKIIRRDIERWLAEDSKAHLTTMFDLYALSRDFPNYDSAIGARNPYKKIEILEDALKNEISNPRFIPYIQLHEFEGLLFSDVKIMDDVLKPYHNYSKLHELRIIRDQFHTPEEIDDGFETAPSKRIINLFKSYQKVTYGYQIAQRIGIDVIRKECPHFNEWMVKLGRLVINGQSRS